MYIYVINRSFIQKGYLWLANKFSNQDICIEKHQLRFSFNISFLSFFLNLMVAAALPFTPCRRLLPPLCLGSLCAEKGCELDSWLTRTRRGAPSAAWALQDWPHLAIILIMPSFYLLPVALSWLGTALVITVKLDEKQSKACVLWRPLRRALTLPCRMRASPCPAFLRFAPLTHPDHMEDTCLDREGGNIVFFLCRKDILQTTSSHPHPLLWLWTHFVC